MKTKPKKNQQVDYGVGCRYFTANGVQSCIILIDRNGRDKDGNITVLPRVEVPAEVVLAAKDLLEVVEGFSTVLTTMAREYKPQEIFALLDSWNAKARVAISKAESK